MTAYPNHRAFYYRHRKKDGQADRFLTFVEEPKPKEGPLRGQPSSSYRVWDRSSGIRVGRNPTRQNRGVCDGDYEEVFSTELQDAWPKDRPLFDDGKEARTNLLARNGGQQLPEDLRQRCERELQRAMEEGRIPPDPPE